MASELSKFIDDELQKVETAEERERLISKLRVRTSAKDSGIAPRVAPSWQEQLLPHKRLLIIGLCTFFLVAIATVAISKGNASSKGDVLEMDGSSEYSYDQDKGQSIIDSAYPMEGDSSAAVMQHQGEIAPHDREQGVESNTPGSPAINIRDDEGSSVTPSNAGNDMLDTMPPVPSSHKRAPLSPSNRKMGPSTAGTTPATTSTSGQHQPTREEADDAEEFGAADADEQSLEPSESLGTIELAPSPGLAEQQEYDRKTAQFEDEVERQTQKEVSDSNASRDPDEPYEGPTTDPEIDNDASRDGVDSLEEGNDGVSGEPYSDASRQSDAAEAKAVAAEIAADQSNALRQDEREIAAAEAEEEGLSSSNEYEG